MKYLPYITIIALIGFLSYTFSKYCKLVNNAYIKTEHVRLDSIFVEGSYPAKFIDFDYVDDRGVDYPESDYSLIRNDEIVGYIYFDEDLEVFVEDLERNKLN